MTPFVHLHLHTEYSLLDGACRIKDIPDKLLQLQQNSCAITDHGVMYGCVQFYKELKQKGIKPIIGCEIYVAPKSRFEKSKVDNSAYYHLVLLCKNETGYKNLIKIVSKAYTEGFYAKPRADLELLETHNDGLIALSGCIGGYIPSKILDDDYQAALSYAIKMHEIFGDGNFYLEIQNHGIEAEKKTYLTLKRLSKETGIGLVATNDSHYISKEDSSTHKVLTSIQTNNSLEFETDEFYIKSGDEMMELFSDCPEAIENTLKISEQCCFDFKFDKMYLPTFVPEDGTDSHSFFQKNCNEGLKRRFEEASSNGVLIDIAAYKKRLDEEIRVISEMGFVEYFLIVADYVMYAKSKDIPVGPGRGSGAGSLAAFCLGITDVDPIKYNLLFERFLNPERVSMPDFDIDFCYERRVEVIDYVSKKYGRERVTQIITFGTMAARAAIRDTARALEIPYNDADTVAKLIPRELNITIDRALETVPELRVIYNENLTLRKLIDVARKLEGMPRNASTHAAAVVISDKSVDEYVPLSTNGGVIVTQYNMNEIAELGLLKMDFLGLRNLTIIRNTEERIRQSTKGFNIENVPLDDKETFKMLSQGATDGVFQLESPGMRSLIMRLMPESIEDITAAISLYRPGPMDSIPKFLNNRKNPDKIIYMDNRLRDILSVTYGCVVYQEQVMQILRVLAGYSYGRADIVRRYMSKKKVNEMEQEKQYFLYGKKRDDGSIECKGTIANGISEDVALKIYDEMSEFAKYAFNKSHACAYSVIAYRTAYLKCHFPKEYMSALITSVLDNEEKVVTYISEIENKGIKVLSPCINRSGMDFIVEEDGIRFGLLAIKNIGRSTLNDILNERTQNGEYKGFEEFLTRTADYGIYEKVIENLIKSGAFDCFGKKRSQLLSVYQSALSKLSKSKSNEVKGQIDLFSQFNSDEIPNKIIIEYPDIPELPKHEMLIFEKEVAGIYFSGHPLLEYSECSEKIGALSVSKIYSLINDEGNGSLSDGQKIVVVGILKNFKTKQTKNNSRMAFADIDSISGSMELIVFPKVLETFGSYIRNGTIAGFAGRLSIKESSKSPDAPDEAKLILETVLPVYKNNSNDISKTLVSNMYNSVSKKPSLDECSSSSQSNFNMNNTSEYASKKKDCYSLYFKLKSNNCTEFKKCINLCEIFSVNGDTPVFVYFENTGKLTKLNYNISINDTFIMLQKKYLGENNVILKNNE